MSIHNFEGNGINFSEDSTDTDRLNSDSGTESSFSTIPTENNSANDNLTVADLSGEISVEDVSTEDNSVEDVSTEDNSVEDVSSKDNSADDASVPDCSDSENDTPVFKALAAFTDIIEVFVYSLVAVLLIFTFCFRLCRVDGKSMQHTLQDGEMLITSNLFYTPTNGDIVVFHLSNGVYAESLVKRVIATEGQTVKISFTTGQVSVDGKVLDEEYAYVSGDEYSLRPDFNREYIFSQDGEVYFLATVPEDKIFVMGDNRNGSSDSRAYGIGFIDVDTVMGKAILRLAPFEWLS